MIAPDINLLVYSVDEDSPFHGRAKAWLEDVLSDAESVGFAWVVLRCARPTTILGDLADFVGGIR